LQTTLTFCRYAVGDLRSKKYRQITTAVADGTIAAIAVTKALDSF
jgi:thioredoxin reductase (NADPH)